MEDLRYPIGLLELSEGLTGGDRSALIDQIADAPAQMREAVAGLTDEQLTPPTGRAAGRFARASQGGVLGAPRLDRI